MLNVNFHVVSYSSLTVLITSLKTTQRGSESEVSSDIYDAFRRRKLSALISSPRRPWRIFVQSSAHKGFFRCEKAFSAPTGGSTCGKAACDWRQARFNSYWFKWAFFHVSMSSDFRLHTLWKLKFNRNWINYWTDFILLSLNISTSLSSFIFLVNLWQFGLQLLLNIRMNSIIQLARKYF